MPSDEMPYVPWQKSDNKAEEYNYYILDSPADGSLETGLKLAKVKGD